MDNCWADHRGISSPIWPWKHLMRAPVLVEPEDLRTTFKDYKPNSFMRVV